MSKNNLRRALAIAALVSSLSGCADYLNRYDTVTLAAGDAQKHNRLLQAVDPFNPNSDNVTIDSNGNVVAAAVDGLNAPAAPAPQPNVTVNVGTPAGQ